MNRQLLIVVSLLSRVQLCCSAPAAAAPSPLRLPRPLRRGCSRATCRHAASAAQAPAASGEQRPWSTGCGTLTSSRPTRSAPTTSWPRTPTSRSTSPSRVGMTTGAASRPAWSPATRPTSSPTTWPSIRSFAAKDQLVDIQPYVDQRQGRSQRLPARPGRPVGPRRQALWPAQGLGHDRHRLQQGHAGQGRRHRGRAQQRHLEPGGRRHLRPDRSPS